jgi:hypothetical protein
VAVLSPEQRRTACERIQTQLNGRREAGQPGDGMWVGEKRAAKAPGAQQFIGALTLFGVHQDHLFSDGPWIGLIPADFSKKSSR